MIDGAYQIDRPRYALHGPKEGHSPDDWPVRAIISVAGPLTISTIDVVGAEHVTDLERSLLAGNHPTWADGFVLRRVFQELGIGVRTVVDQKLFHNPITRGYYERRKSLGVSAHPKSEDDRSQNIRMIDEAAGEIVAGGNVSLFATGGHMGDFHTRFRKGCFRIADTVAKKVGQAQIVPFGIRVDAAIRSGSFPFRGKYTVSFGEPIAYEAGAGDDVKDEVRKRMFELAV